MSLSSLFPTALSHFNIRTLATLSVESDPRSASHLHCSDFQPMFQLTSLTFFGTLSSHHLMYRLRYSSITSCGPASCVFVFCLVSRLLLGQPLSLFARIPSLVLLSPFSPSPGSVIRCVDLPSSTPVISRWQGSHSPLYAPLPLLLLSSHSCSSSLSVGFPLSCRCPFRRLTASRPANDIETQ